MLFSHYNELNVVMLFSHSFQVNKLAYPDNNYLRQIDLIINIEGSGNISEVLLEKEGVFPLCNFTT